MPVHRGHVDLHPGLRHNHTPTPLHPSLKAVADVHYNSLALSRIVRNDELLELLHVVDRRTTVMGGVQRPNEGPARLIFPPQKTLKVQLVISC
ncbi:hypothetical protein BDV98DRAFT_560042 [Pterulicium gracile]|uniref:Uncharacterized protein n=1 Tax=Pterulicium gracile TaxID=1884261 RepID=A0A5C3R1U8_9AGAR|nr:hypothetical protein BDV98DRAFT_560042 [Pterula gracilis]